MAQIKGCEEKADVWRRAMVRQRDIKQERKTRGKRERNVIVPGIRSERACSKKLTAGISS